MPPVSTNFLRVLAEAQQGSAEALAALFEALRPYLLSLVNNQLEAELHAKGGGSDLVQETYLEAQRDIRNFQGSSEQELANWLRSILLHNLANFRRHYRRVAKRDISREQDEGCLIGMPEKTSTSPGTSTPEMVAITTEELANVEHALDELPSPYREVVRWRSVDRRSFKRIAKDLNVSEKTAQRIWVKGIQQLRDRLAK